MAESSVKIKLLGVDEASGVIGRVGGALGNLGKLAGGAVLGGIGAATAGIAALGTASFSAAMTLDDAMDTIAVGTGATGDALEALGDDFKAAFSEMPYDAKTVANALAELNTKTGLTGVELQDMTKQLVKMTELAGGDATQNARLFGRMLGDWGVPMEEAATAMDKVFVASQASGLSVEGFMNKVVQFGAPLRQMGYGMDEAVAMFAKWEKEGVNAELVMGSLRIAAANFASSGEKTAEAVAKVNRETAKAERDLRTYQDQLVVAEQKQKEFTATTKESEKIALAQKIAELKTRIQETSTVISDNNAKLERWKNMADVDLPDALRQSMEQIQNAKTDTEALGIAMEVFGARAGPDMAAAIREGRFAIDDLVGMMQDAGGAIDDTAARTEDFPEKFERMKNKATVALAPIGGLIMDAIGKGLDAVQPHVDAAVGWFTDTLGPAIADVMGDIEDGWSEGGLIGAIANGVTRIGELLGLSEEDATALWNTMVDVMTGIETAFNAVVTWVQTNWPTIRAVIEGVFNAIKTIWESVLQPVLSTLFDIIGKIVSWVIENWPQISATFETVFNAAKTIFEEVLWPIMSLIPKLLGDAINWVIENWPQISATFETVFGAIQQVWETVLKPVITGIVDGAKDAVKWASSSFQQLQIVAARVFGAVKTAIETAIATFTSIRTSAEQSFNAVKSAIETAITNAIEYLKTLPQKMLEFGKNIIKGIVDGITSAPTAIADALGGVVNSAIDSVKKTLGIQSPSKLFAWFGKNMMIGLAEGIQKFGDLPANRLGNVVSGMAVRGMSGASVVNNYNYNPTYATAPRNPAQDFAIMRALAVG